MARLDGEVVEKEAVNNNNRLPAHILQLEL